MLEKWKKALDKEENMSAIFMDLFFELAIKLKLNWLNYTQHVTCQPSGHNKCNKICDTDTASRWGKVLIFKPKACGFKLSRNIYFREFKFSFAVNFHIAKPEMLASQKCDLQTFIFQKVTISQQFLINKLGRFEYIFRCLKCFFQPIAMERH